MSYRFWEAVAETPWWIHWMLLCFIYLAYLGTKPRIIFLKSAVIIQGISMGLLIIALFFFAKITLHNILICSSVTLTGIFLGWSEFRYSKVKAIKNKSQIYLPGSWNLFILIFIFVIANYYMDMSHHYIISIETLKQEKFMKFFLALSGLSIGLFIGRTYYLVHCLKNGPFLEK
ncbi:MAG: hypothetical protein KIT56_08535 [Gammaproteobacteria bacterium]|nr:hypothetical protein [Gammaproteobacteria bacterium]MCW5583904.1 hypothetical protein [Gammaproteobacteria bacterium]